MSDPPRQTVNAADFTFSGSRGTELCRQIARVSAGLMTVDEAADELTRRPDGTLQLQVTRQTIHVLAGRALISAPS